ncbi:MULTISPECIES: tail fiber assembly protein [Pectobacterium]|uniref:Tail fiber assembly protein n=1 Tax=Pectobacterium zantedeschiae TaxID=2034769 RepID=A0A9X8JG89_9GAMM|nr:MULTISPECIES: tail fiber assembly protein [Pectobacterium]RYC38881.1 tail fiber assembly protein [Pectobacterium zantedeschiae]WKA61083.1 tail fiber assembly protein [Pectobacterium aroidearum]
MMILYSPTTNGFYQTAWQDEYAAAGTLPADTVTLTPVETRTYWRQVPPAGKMLGAKKGRPVWINAPSITKAALASMAANQKTALLAHATEMIAPLKDALDGGYIDERDKLILSDWQKYRYALTKVDVSTAPDIDWPLAPGGELIATADQ